MKLNLKDYVIKQSSFLENDFCDETIIKLNELEKLKWEKHTYHKRGTNEIVSNGDEVSSLLLSLLIFFCN